jgi:hypothetical protein
MALTTKLAATVMAAAAATVLAAGTPALASSHGNNAITSLTGPEVISGTVHGREALLSHPAIPLRWSGLVSTHSVIRLGGPGIRKGDIRSLSSPAGRLDVLFTRKPQSRHSFNTRTCQYGYVQELPLRILGGRSTRQFAGASGPGAVQVGFSGYLPRYTSGPKKGQCRTSAQPMNKGAKATFLASLVLTLR